MSRLKVIFVRILITGANGRCGTCLTTLGYEKIFLDQASPPAIFKNEDFIQDDLSDINFLGDVLTDCDVLIHLAATSSPQSPWEDVLKNNIIAVRNIFKAAFDAKLDRIIFTSSNHVVGMYELENVPDIYELDNNIKIDHNSAPRPDSYYAVSKLFGENLGRYYAEMGGPKFYSLRIGAVLDEFNDNPYAYAEDGVRKKLWKRGDSEYILKLKRLKAIWQSRRDFNQMVDLCIRHEGSSFQIFYATSNNARSWLDISHAKEVLGYKPLDNAEEWTKLPEIYNCEDEVRK